MTSGTTPEFEEISVDEIWDDDSRSSRRVPPTKPVHPSIVELVQTVISEGQTLITSQIQLLKMKGQTTGKKIAIATGLILTALVLVFYMIGWLLRTIELALANVLPGWAASLIVAGILLVAIIVLVLIGVNVVKRAVADKPTAEGFQTDLDVVKEAVKEGKGE